jgi:radical SAM superfamily enzyme YgiQ (UPF0313 family)
MKIGLFALSGVRVKNPSLVELGVTLPGFVRRGQVIASLPSLGLLTVAGLTPPGHEVHYFEVDDVRGFEPPGDFDLVGISSFTAKINDAYHLAAQLRAQGTPVALGGLHVSLMPEEAAQHADAIVVGGAEGAWPKLVQDAAAGRMRARYQGATRDVFTPALYRMPRFDLLAGRPYNRITIQTTRGCPRACEFCAASLRINQRYEQKPVDRVIAELHEARKHFPHPFVELADDNTFLNRAWSKQLLRALQRENIHYFTETDASVVDDLELCDLLAASGCRQVLIGFESPRADDLAGMDPANWKRRQVPHIERIVDVLQSRGVSVNGCFILGLDNQTEDVFPELLDLVRRSGLAEVQYTVSTPFPGTPLHQRLQREERLLPGKGNDDCTLFDVNFLPKRMSVTQLEQGLRWLFAETYTKPETQRRMRHFARQKRRGVRLPTASRVRLPLANESQREDTQ